MQRDAPGLRNSSALTDGQGAPIAVRGYVKVNLRDRATSFRFGNRSKDGARCRSLEFRFHANYAINASQLPKDGIFIQQRIKILILPSLERKRGW